MKNFLVLDLSNLGSAYSIINRFVDNENIEVFEISPIGTAALLILNVNDSISSQLLYNNIKNEYKSDLMSMALITDIEPSVVKTYLSQSQAQIQKNLLILESSEVSRMFSVAQNAATKGTIGLVDFRVIRTNPCNAVLVITSDQISNLMTFKDFGVKTTLINDVQNSVKEYFEIIK